MTTSVRIGFGSLPITDFTSGYASVSMRRNNTEIYCDLVVRIAGYCAYFVNLSPPKQAEINARTEERI
jgi:autonomous glycyl radical cofactor GrcA